MPELKPGEARAVAAWVCVARLALTLAIGCGDDGTRAPLDGPPSSTAACAPECAAGLLCVQGECEEPTCVPEGTACTSSGRGIAVCNPDGSTALRLCGARQRCSEEGGVAVCEQLACSPDEWQCTSDGRGVRRCMSDGRGFSDAQACADDEECRDGACEAVPLPACEPSSLACDGDIVIECQEDGLGFLATELDCAEHDQACIDGACADRVCVGFECHEGKSYRCAQNGTSLALDAVCGAANGSYCNGLTGRCSPYVCVPGSAVCNGTLATRCNDEGSAPLEEGVACDPSKACWDGGCLPRVCATPFSCNGTTLLACDKGGSELREVQTCDPGSSCDANAGACVPASCEANSPACRFNVATKCNASGLGFAPGGEDCSLSGQACVAGACIARLCTPNAVFCADGTLNQCNEYGSQFAQLDTCTESETCKPELFACVPHECSPSAPLCAGNVLTQCKPDGSGPLSGGTDCSDGGEACVDGACQPLVCNPSATFCQLGNVFLCNASGTASALFVACDAQNECESSQGSAQCGKP